MAKFKRPLLFLLSFAPAIALADSQAVGGQWRGLHNSDASIFIADNEAQDLSNVDITDSGYSIKKRAGTTQFKTIGVSTWGVRGGYFFTDTGGNPTIVHANDQSVYESVAGAAYSAFITTDTAGSYYDFSDSQGYLWRATNNRDEIARYDGTNLTYYPSAPKGNQIEFMPDRAVITGTSANPNRLNFSKKADFTDYVVGDEEADPFTTDVGLPGQDIKAIKYALGRLLIWTKTGLSYWYGESQYDQSKEDISTTIGTDQPYSIISDLGVVYWQGQDKHFYGYDGSSVYKISSALDISNIGGNAIASWATTTEDDFEAGTINPGVSATSAPGDLVFSAIISQLTQHQRPQYDVRALAQSFTPEDDFILSYASVLIDHPTSGSSFTSTWTIRTDNAGVPSSTILSTATLTITNDGLSNLTRSLSFSPSISLTDGTVYWLYLASAPALGFSGKPTWNDAIGNPYSGGNLWSSDGGALTNLDACFALYNSSAVFVSEAFNMGSGASSFLPVEINNTILDAAVTYSIYQDTNTAIDINDLTTFTSSQTITNGGTPTIGLGPYLFWSVLFTRTASTHTAAVNDFTMSWNTTNSVFSWGSVDKDHRLLWAVAEGAETSLSATYIYDPRFDSWLKYSQPITSVAKVGDSLYFGGVSTGVVYIYPSGNSDNGSAFTSYWESKDFISGDPFIEKDYINYSIIAKAQSGSNMDVTYTVNASSSISANYSLNADVSGSAFRRMNANLPSGKFGTLFSFRFGNDDADAPFEVYTFKYDYRPKPWRVLP